MDHSLWHCISDPAILFLLLHLLVTQSTTTKKSQFLSCFYTPRKTLRKHTSPSEWDHSVTFRTLFLSLNGLKINICHDTGSSILVQGNWVTSQDSFQFNFLASLYSIAVCLEREEKILHTYIYIFMYIYIPLLHSFFNNTGKVRSEEKIPIQPLTTMFLFIHLSCTYF